MLTRAILVCKLHDGKLLPHDHPVFTGNVFYDKPNRGQDITIDDEHQVRTFTSESEVITAVNDYVREDQDQEEITPFILVWKFSIHQEVVSRKRTKEKTNKQKQ